MDTKIPSIEEIYESLITLCEYMRKHDILTFVREGEIRYHCLRYSYGEFARMICMGNYSRIPNIEKSLKIVSDFVPDGDSFTFYGKLIDYEKKEWTCRQLADYLYKESIITPFKDEQVKVVGTIDLTPTWKGMMPILLEGVRKGDVNCIEELNRLAAFADQVNVNNKRKDRERRD